MGMTAPRVFEDGIAPEDIITDAAATRLAAWLKTPL